MLDIQQVKDEDTCAWCGCSLAEDEGLEFGTGRLYCDTCAKRICFEDD
jgi:hypothetical protein